MKQIVAIKVVSLLLALAGVLYMMKAINAESVSRALSAFGIEPGAATSPGLQPSNRPIRGDEKRLNLCRTRVHALIWPDGRKVEEKTERLKMVWFAHDPQPRELDYLKMEKWFSLHCQILISEKPQGDSGSASSATQFAPFLTLQFVDQSKLEIGRKSDGVFRIGERQVTSEDFESAVRELEDIAGFVPSSAP